MVTAEAGQAMSAHGPDAATSIPELGSSSPAAEAPNGDTVPWPIPTKSLADLRHPPPHLSTLRRRLFEIKGRIELRQEEFDLYWPYIDNVWVRQHRANAERRGRYTTDYYACRLHRPTYTPTKGPRPEGKPTRKKQIREGGTCQMRLKIIRYEGGFTGLSIMQIGEQGEHTHDLDHIDKIKRASALMDIARSEVMKGYMPASVYTVMSQDREKLTLAGGDHLNRNDVRNASQAWRQQHRGELHVHPGYKYDHGNGIVRQEDIDPDLANAKIRINDDPPENLHTLPSNTLYFPLQNRPPLESYLPPLNLSPDPTGQKLPHVTLTYATSLDSSLTLAPGLPTALSGPESKAMTHYLRSRHDAILIGVSTATADDPALNCRLEGTGGYGGLGWEGQPRPVVLDPSARWLLTQDSRIIKTVREGKGRGPWVVIAPDFAMDPTRLEMLKFYGGKYLGLKEFDERGRLKWEAILKALAAEGVRSVMIEGGGKVINGLLSEEHKYLIDSVIVTVAPTYLGKGGVVVSPSPRQDEEGRPRAVVKFRDVRWLPLGEDVVMCGKVQREEQEG